MDAVDGNLILPGSVRQYGEFKSNTVLYKSHSKKKLECAQEKKSSWKISKEVVRDSKAAHNPTWKTGNNNCAIESPEF